MWLDEMQQDGFDVIGSEIENYAITANDRESEHLIHQLKRFLQIPD